MKTFKITFCCNDTKKEIIQQEFKENGRIEILKESDKYWIIGFDYNEEIGNPGIFYYSFMNNDIEFENISPMKDRLSDFFTETHPINLSGEKTLEIIDEITRLCRHLKIETVSVSPPEDNGIWAVAWINENNKIEIFTYKEY